MRAWEPTRLSSFTKPIHGKMHRIYDTSMKESVCPDPVWKPVRKAAPRPPPQRQEGVQKPNRAGRTEPNGTSNAPGSSTRMVSTYGLPARGEALCSHERNILLNIYYILNTVHYILDYTRLYYDILCYAMLRYAMLDYTIQYNTIEGNAIQYHTLLRCN